MKSHMAGQSEALTLLAIAHHRFAPFSGPTMDVQLDLCTLLNRDRQGIEHARDVLVVVDEGADMEQLQRAILAPRNRGQREFRPHNVGDDPLQDMGCEPRHGPAQMLGHGKVDERALQGPAHGPFVLAPEGPAMLAVVGRPILGNDQGQAPALRPMHSRHRGIRSDMKVNQVGPVALALQPFAEPGIRPFDTPTTGWPIRDEGRQCADTTRHHLLHFPPPHGARGVGPCMEHRTLHIRRQAFNVTADEVAQLGVHPVRMPAGHVEHTHGCKMHWMPPASPWHTDKLNYIQRKKGSDFLLRHPQNTLLINPPLAKSRKVTLIHLFTVF